VEVLKYPGCLAPLLARLRVNTSRYDYDAAALVFSWLFAMCGSIGVSLLAVVGTRRYPKPTGAAGSLALSGLASAPILWKPRPPRKPPLPGLPAFSFLTANILILLVIISWVGRSVVHVVPTGLRVRTLRPGVFRPPSPGIQPLVVELRLAGKNPRPELYLDFRPVAWDDFAKSLEKEIRRRPADFPVYVQGDPEMAWGWAAKAIDEIKGFHVEVVMLTRALVPPAK